MNLSHLPFKLGLALGNGFVPTPRRCSASVNSLVNLVSRSCITRAGDCSRPDVSLTNRSACSVTQAEFGCSVEVETSTSRLLTHSQTRTSELEPARNKRSPEASFASKSSTSGNVLQSFRERMLEKIKKYLHEILRSSHLSSETGSTC